MFKSQIKLKLILAILLVWTILFPIVAHEFTKLPPEMPISLSPPGSVDTIVHIRLQEPYLLKLCFYDEENPFGTRERILGYKNQGVIIPIQWELYSTTTQQLILNGQFESEKGGGWSKEYCYREVGNMYYKPGEFLEPGYYRFVARIPRDVPELANVRARIQIGAFHDGFANWAVWGWIISPLIWIIEFILTIILIRRIIVERKIR